MTATLYHFWRSSSSWRVRWALAVKGIAFESVILDLFAGQQQSAEHRARSPLGYVPALDIDGRTLTESVAIIEYLEETVPETALYPRDPWQRARVRQIVELINAGIQPLQNLNIMTRHSADQGEQKAWAHHYNERGMAALEQLLTMGDAELGQTGTFAFGDRLTAADLCLVPQVYSARRFGVDLDRFPRVLAAERAALATEHAAGALPENQPGAPKGN